MENNFHDNVVFCPTCNYVLAKRLCWQARSDYLCPNCLQARISNFYEYGSDKHKAAWEDHQKNGNPPLSLSTRKIPPLPFPYEDGSDK